MMARNLPTAAVLLPPGGRRLVRLHCALPLLLLLLLDHDQVGWPSKCDKINAAVISASTLSNITRMKAMHVSVTP